MAEIKPGDKVLIRGNESKGVGVVSDKAPVVDGIGRAFRTVEWPDGSATHCLESLLIPVGPRRGSRIAVRSASGGMMDVAVDQGLMIFRPDNGASELDRSAARVLADVADHFARTGEFPQTIAARDVAAPDETAETLVGRYGEALLTIAKSEPGHSPDDLRRIAFAALGIDDATPRGTTDGGPDPS